MKFYNIFKPHIVEFADGNFAVRKRGWCGLMWVYKDRNAWMGGFFEDIMWWTLEYIDHSKVSTFDKAMEVMAKQPPDKQTPKTIVKVYHSHG
jgi:hypothetical protein